MIQSYYDSDEDVYWGPVSLPELKRHAMSTRSKEDIESRRTIHCDPSFLDNLEKRAEEITQVTPPRRSRARLSSLPSGNEDSGKDANKEIYRYHETNGALMLSSNGDIFMQRSKRTTSPSLEDCMDIDNAIVQNNRNNNSSGSVLFEKSSSIELLQENIIIETSTSDEVGIVRDLNITDRQCSGDIVSINLTIKRNEEDNEVAAPQIAIVEEPELQNTSEKLDPMSSNTFMGNESEVLHFNENNFDKYIATETPCQVELRLDGDINEANAALCRVDLMSAEINEQENVSLKLTCDTNEQIVRVKEVHIQNRHNASDLMWSRNIMEELNVNENIDKSNVNMPCSSSSHDISTSDMISFKDSNNMNFNENYEHTSDGDGTLLKLNTSSISNLNNSIHFRYCDDLAEILPMDPLPHEKHVHVNMEKQYSINNHELPDNYLNYGVSREQTNFIEMDALLRHEHEVCFKKLVEREENPNNDCIHLQNVSKLFHCNVNVSNTSKIDSNVEIRYCDSCRLKKEKSTCNIDSGNEFENYLTIKNNHNGESRVLEVQPAHKDDNQYNDNQKNCSIQNSKNDDASSPDSFNFNDTLDEIERALEKGLNYSMSVSPPNTSTSKCVIVEPILNNDAIVENTPLRKKVLEINSSQKIAYKKPTCKYYNILSPVAAYIRSQSRRRINSQFKSPGKPIKEKVSPAVKSKYKSVASPVGVYIKNTPTAPIYEKVTPMKNVQKRMKIYSLENINNKENLSASFPEVIYKPAQHTIMKDNETHLTRKIDCLLPVKSSIIKHEARTLNHNSSVSRKLLEDDLTLNKSDSNFDISLQDTSIHSKKRTYISKFPVVKN